MDCRIQYKYSWRKMDAAAQNRAEDGEEWFVTANVPLGVTRLKFSKL